MKSQSWSVNVRVIGTEKNGVRHTGPGLAVDDQFPPL